MNDIQLTQDLLNMNIKKLQIELNNNFDDKLKSYIIKELIKKKTKDNSSTTPSQRFEKYELGLISEIMEYEDNYRSEQHMQRLPHPQTRSIKKNLNYQSQGNLSRLAVDADIKNIQKKTINKYFDPPYEV